MSKAKPRFKVEQVVAVPNRHGLRPIYFQVDKITWDASWSDLRYHADDADGEKSVLEHSLRPLTAREMGQRRRKGK